MTLAIAGHNYEATPIPAGEFGSKAYRLEKVGTACVYDVILTHDDIIECDCPSFEMTHRNMGTACKHGLALIRAGLLNPKGGA